MASLTVANAASRLTAGGLERSPQPAGRGRVGLRRPGARLGVRRVLRRRRHRVLAGLVGFRYFSCRACSSPRWSASPRSFRPVSSFRSTPGSFALRIGVQIATLVVGIVAARRRSSRRGRSTCSPISADGRDHVDQRGARGVRRHRRPYLRRHAPRAEANFRALRAKEALEREMIARQVQHGCCPGRCRTCAAWVGGHLPSIGVGTTMTSFPFRTAHRARRRRRVRQRVPARPDGGPEASVRSWRFRHPALRDLPASERHAPQSVGLALRHVVLRDLRSATAAFNTATPGTS